MQRSSTSHENAPADESPPGAEQRTSPEAAAASAGAEGTESWALPLEILLGQLGDGVYVIDGAKVRPVNRAALTLLGYSREEEFQHDLLGLARELDARDGRTGEPLSPSALRLPESAKVRELIIRHRGSGEERFVRCALAPVVMSGAVVGAVAVGSDMTEHARAKFEASKRAEFEQQLIGIVSHDLRNPLQVIRFAGSLGLRAAAGDARQSRQFERILSSSARALRMIDDLLDFTRIRFAGGLSVDARGIELHELTRRVVDEVLTTHPERTVQVHASGDDRGYWDPDRLEQVVQNLVSNALQHTTEGTRVEVSTRGEPDGVLLEVHNGGPGIPAEDQARLFEPFQRGKTKSRSGRSMGLGLHITRHIVLAHGGTLALRSSDEHGTTFSVRLPRGHDPEQGLGTA